MKQARKPKKIAYLLVDRESESGKPLYRILHELLATHHQDLKDARIALAWNLSWQPDVDGRCILGKLKRASDLDRELAAYDAVVLLRRKFFEDSQVTETQKKALIDHELCHLAVKLDAEGEPVVDQKGRTVFRTRHHDFEEFSQIIERYGCWTHDLEAFARALDQARTRASNYVGYTSLHERLREIGVTIAFDTIVLWSEEQRREADVWVSVQHELRQRDLAGVEVSAPPHVQAAIDAVRQADLVLPTDEPAAVN